MSVEFRVRWRRDGRRISTRIVQSWDTAYGIVRRVEDMERHRHDPEAIMADGRRYSQFESMTPLVERPVIEVRDVGEWRLNKCQPVIADGPPPHRAPVDADEWREWETPF